MIQSRCSKMSMYQIDCSGDNEGKKFGLCNEFNYLTVHSMPYCELEVIIFLFPVACST